MFLKHQQFPAEFQAGCQFEMDQNQMTLTVQKDYKIWAKSSFNSEGKHYPGCKSFIFYKTVVNKNLLSVDDLASFNIRSQSTMT